MIFASFPLYKKLAIEERRYKLRRKQVVREMRFRLPSEVLPGQRAGGRSSNPDNAPVQMADAQENRSISGSVADRARDLPNPLPES